MNDLSNKDDIKVLIDLFYQRAKNDELIGPIFSKHVKSNEWPTHLERMYDFWNSAVFMSREYIGNPFAKHIPLNLEERHFTRWLSLFSQTVDENFMGDNAEDVKNRAMKMGVMFQAKLKYLKDNDNLTSIM